MGEKTSSVRRVSGFNNAIYLPLETLIAWLLAFENPAFSAFSIRHTSGKCLRTISALPSEETLSTTNTSNSIPDVFSYRDVRHSLSNSLVFQETTITLKSTIHSLFSH